MSERAAVGRSLRSPTPLSPSGNDGCVCGQRHGLINFVETHFATASVDAPGLSIRFL